MDFLRGSQISYNNNFQLLGVSNNSIEFNNNNIDALNDLSETLNKNLNQSVFDLMTCFICLSPTQEPLSCPKCNNFACKKCLRNYFGGSSRKKCPICKQEIKFNEMKESEIIKEIENILNSGLSKEKKVEKLSKLINAKKNEWYIQNNYINKILEKMLNYQKFLKEYKNQYDLFLLTCQKVVEKAFKSYSKKVEDLIESLLSFSEVASNSIKKYDDINKKNSTYYYNNNIKDLINEILTMDRKHFNELNNDKTEEFLNKPMKIIPSVSEYKIREIKIKKSDFSKYGNLKTEGNHYKLGNYKLIYNYNISDGYKAYCKLSFSTKKDFYCCFLFTQRKIDKNKKEKLFPMKLTKKEDNNLEYECIINFDEFDDNKENEVNMIIESLMFSM